MMQLQRRNIGWWWLLGLGCLQGCTKDVARFSPGPLSDTAWVQQVSAASAVARLRDTLQLPSSTNTVVLNQPDTLSFCILPGSGWVTQQGTAYTGPAQVQMQLLDKPGEWIRVFAGTFVQGLPVSADAIAYLNVSAGGMALSATDLIRFTLGDSLWLGNYVQNALQWNAASTQTGWLLFGTTLAAGGGQLTVTVPATFSNANTVVFCWLPDKRVLACLQGDFASRTFGMSGLPSSNQATIISLTMTGSGYYLGVQPAALTGGAVSVTLSPALQSLGYITSYLEQL